MVVVAPHHLAVDHGEADRCVGQNAWLRSTGWIDGVWAARAATYPSLGDGSVGTGTAHWPIRFIEERQSVGSNVSGMTSRWTTSVLGTAALIFFRVSRVVS